MTTDDLVARPGEVTMTDPTIAALIEAWEAPFNKETAWHRLGRAAHIMPMLGLAMPAIVAMASENERLRAELAEAKRVMTAVDTAVSASHRPEDWFSALSELHAALAQPQPKGECNYPDCRCPFDAPADPNWCALNKPKKQKNGEPSHG